MDIYQFNDNIKPLLSGYLVQNSSFTTGDFGALERVELEGNNKLATLDFWFAGWLGVDVFDCSIDEQVMNVLLSPEEAHRTPYVIKELLRILEI